MIDIALLRTDPDRVRRTVEQRGADVDVDHLVKVDAWARLPNLLPDDTPAGDDSGNVELRREGDSVATDEARYHDTVGAVLGILDLARGAEVAGSGFYYWRGDGARLAWAVFTYAQTLLHGRGFMPMMTPLLAREKVFFGTGCLPFFAEEVYQVQGIDLALIGTSEQTLIGYYGDRILDVEDLPICVSAFSPLLPYRGGRGGSRAPRRVPRPPVPQGRADRAVPPGGLRVLAR